MSKTSDSRTDRRELGWFAAGMLFLFLSSSAWALDLDLDQSIHRQDKEATQILSTLGHGKRPNQKTSRATCKKVYVVLLHAHKHKKV